MFGIHVITKLQKLEVEKKKPTNKGLSVDTTPNIIGILIFGQILVE